MEQCPWVGAGHAAKRLVEFVSPCDTVCSCFALHRVREESGFCLFESQIQSGNFFFQFSFSDALIILKKKNPNPKPPEKDPKPLRVSFLCQSLCNIFMTAGRNTFFCPMSDFICFFLSIIMQEIFTIYDRFLFCKKLMSNMLVHLFLHHIFFSSYCFLLFFLCSPFLPALSIKFSSHDFTCQKCLFLPSHSHILRNIPNFW